jgi:hypothetical protein
MGRSCCRGADPAIWDYTESKKESMALDDQQGFHIVIAAIGMGEVKRIRRRLRN